MKKILVPVDFSAPTDITCRYAIEMARGEAAELKLFHTYFDQVILADTSFPDTLDMSTVYNEELIKEIFHHAERNMEELTERLTTLMNKEKIDNITLSHWLTGGELEHDLKDICREYHPDLVVMGTTGRGNTVNVWGKVSTFIIDHAKVPVITVPPMRSFKGFDDIMFAADLSGSGPAMLNQLLTLYPDPATRIHVVHFVKNVHHTDAWVKMKNLQLQFQEQEKQGRMVFEVVEVEEDNQQAINKVISDKSITLIAFKPHKRSLMYMTFTKNITKKNLFAANIPLIALPG
jgi:nucleotide-binding universal stress UspA family protein